MHFSLNGRGWVCHGGLPPVCILPNAAKPCFPQFLPYNRDIHESNPNRGALSAARGGIGTSPGPLHFPAIVLIPRGKSHLLWTSISSSGQLVEKEVERGSAAVAGDEEISSSVRRRRGLAHPEKGRKTIQTIPVVNRRFTNYGVGVKWRFCNSNRALC